MNQIFTAYTRVEIDLPNFLNKKCNNFLKSTNFCKLKNVGIVAKSHSWIAVYFGCVNQDKLFKNALQCSNRMLKWDMYIFTFNPIFSAFTRVYMVFSKEFLKS